LGNGAWIGAWGIKKSFYMENGDIKYGPLEPGYKDFLATMRKWYSEGLIDRNIATVDNKILDANMTSGKTGATVWNSGAGIGKWLPPLKESDPKADLVAAPYPVLNKGDKPKFGQKDFGYSSQASVAITTSSKNAELAVKMLDYAYSPEGHLFFNFGTEGVSYNLIDGYPKYTDLVMKNTDNLAPAQALSQHMRSAYNGPFVQDKRYIEQYLALPQQQEAINIWSNTDTDLYSLPPITPTPEESSEFSSIMNDVDTLVNEMTLKIILGNDSIDSYEEYVKKLKSLNIDRAIEIQKAALERFNNR
jgi:putative aldouronate transport system substrate-binding protein